MIKIANVFFVAFIIGSLQASAQNGASPQVYIGKVLSVEDGRTVIVLVDTKKIRVELLAVGSLTQSLSKDSRENLKRLVTDKEIEIYKTGPELKKKDSISGKIVLNNQDIGLEQIRCGFAWYSSEDEQYQNIEDRRLYEEAEQRAKTLKQGIWSDSFKDCKAATVPTSLNPTAKLGSEGSKKPKVVGTVLVGVTLNESGDVTSARALCGHPLLQTVAVKKALEFKFKPIGRIVIGTMTFNFEP